MNKLEMNSKENILQAVRNAVTSLYGGSIDSSNLITEKPKQNDLGDVAVPMFSLSKALQLAPPVIASRVASHLQEIYPSLTINPVGPYLNIFYDKTSSINTILNNILQANSYGHNSSLANKKVMIEFSGPNTNKPLHLGHLRNDALGEALCRIYSACEAKVMRVNIINDRGIHICKSMLAYQLFANGATPESTGRKSDHFVGDYYVKYNDYAKTNEEQAESQSIAMLNAWEAGDEATLKLWRLMNDWAIDGIKETYAKTNISFDKIYYESETYKLGKDIIEQGLANNTFYRHTVDGSIRMDVRELDNQANEDFDQDKGKVFLRGDGTSVYITQDLGTAVKRQQDFPFDSLVYVVASEQKRHFELLFYAITKLGYSWGKDMFHLSYGMVNLPDGKMKSREGTVVDADNLLDELTTMAQGEIDSKGRTSQVESETAFKIALGALHYYLLQVNPAKDMTFHKEESLSFNGNTGPYLQYSAVRIASMLSKAEAKPYLTMALDSKLLSLDDEWQIVRLLGDFSEVVAKAAKLYEPNLIANYLYEVAKAFNKYYHDTPILTDENKGLVASRLHLCQAIHTVLKNGMSLLNIPYVDRM